MRKSKFLNKGLRSSEEDTDPLSGMANLFDLGMVFSVALMIGLILQLRVPEFFSQQDFTIVKNPGKDNMEIIKKEGKKIEKYKGTKGNSEGKGKKIGTAYQLENGEIIYIPENTP